MKRSTACVQDSLRFDGSTFEAQDGRRLFEQLQVVFDAMKDRAWRTLAEISANTLVPEASVSARLRDLRKPRFGSLVVERRRRTRAQYEYRVLPRCASPDTPPGECDAFEAGETTGSCPPGFCATAPEPPK